jgi:hypothetical protein
VSAASYEWDDYRRSKARAWLHKVRHAISAMRALQYDLQAERESYDMMRGIAYDSEDKGSDMVHGDDSIVSHIEHIAEACSKRRHLTWNTPTRLM